MKVKLNEITKDKNLYMMSFLDCQELRHIRNPFLTHQEINEWMKYISLSYPRFSDIEIFKDDTLDTSFYKFNESSDETKQITLRQYLFGDLYEETSQDIKNNPENLKLYKTD
jgi:hypothetical protein